MEKITLTKKEFKEIAEVLKATAKENIRPVLQGVNFNGNEVVGLSSYRLMLRKINAELKGSYTIHKNDLKQVLKEINRDTKHIEIIFNQDTAVFKIDNKENFIFNVMQQDYINYKQLIPTEFNLTVTIEAKKIIESIKPLRKNHYVILDISKDLINIKDIYYTKRDKQGNQEKIMNTIVNDFINCNTIGDNKKNCL